jgi:hypothetical protein
MGGKTIAKLRLTLPPKEHGPFIRKIRTPDWLYVGSASFLLRR